MQIEQNRANHDPSTRIRNDRILDVPDVARREREWASIDALSPRVKEELEHFTIAATSLEGKDVRVIAGAVFLSFVC
jgi:hypothetical protein